MSVMELFADPSTMHQLSMGDKLIGAGMTTVMGMGMTFIILLLLWGCIALMNKIIATVTKKPKATDAAPAVKPAAAPAPAVAPQVAAAETVDADEALIAVITAAIAAYEAGSGVTSDLVVKKISRIAGPSVAWSAAGRSECIDNRRI